MLEEAVDLAGDVAFEAALGFSGGSRHGLRPDWINDAAKLKTVAVAADPEPVFEGARLVVESAGPRYILAMMTYDIYVRFRVG